MNSGLSSRTLKVGVVGCGAIASPHVTTLNAYRDKKASDLSRKRVGVIEFHLFDLDRQHAKALNDKHILEAAIHDTLESLLGSGLDAVFVLTPPVAHADICSAALRNGISVFVEKPFTCRYDEAVKLYDLAKTNDAMLCVGHSTLFMPNVKALLARIASGEFGRPVAFHCFYGHAEQGGKIPYKDPSHWAYKTPGGLLINHISHPASLFVELMGRPLRILPQTASYMILPNEMSDSLSVSILGEAGMGTITIAMAQGNHHRHATIWCEKGTIMLDLTRQTIVESKHGGPIGLVPKMLGGVQAGIQQVMQTIGVGVKVVLKRLKREPGVRALAEEFIVSLRTNGNSPVSEANALGVQAIIEHALFHGDTSLRKPGQ